MVGKETLEINYGLVEEHTCDTSSIGVAKRSINDGVDLVTNEVLSGFLVNNNIEILDVKEGKRELLLEHVHLLLAWCLLLVLAWLSWATSVSSTLLVASTATSATTASTATLVASSVLEVPWGTSLVVLVLLAALIVLALLLLERWEVPWV